MFTCKKRPEVGMLPSDRLDASTPSRGKTHNRVMIWSSEWENPSSGVGPPSGGNLSSEIGFTIANEWGF